MRPPCSRRTLTSPKASVPWVTLETEYSCRFISTSTKELIALKVASTAPAVCAVAVFSSPSIESTTVAEFCSPVSVHTFSDTNLIASFSSVCVSDTSACRSSSKISCFLSANSLKRLKASFRLSSDSNSTPNSLRRALKALRPECLPSTN